MDSETVLFLREPVAGTALLEALTELFGISPEAWDTALVVDYPQGYATGISIPCAGGLAVRGAARKLASRLDTAVLLEACGSGDEKPRWLLFTPGALRPQAVQVVELRHGLDVVTCTPVPKRPPRMAYA